VTTLIDKRVRDLSSDEFNDAYKADRFTISVISSRMSYIMQHMCTSLFKEAFSSILRDYYDFGAAINGPQELNYAMSNFSDSLLVFAATMEPTVRNVVEEYGIERLRPGDVLICNDAYRCGTHVNDMAFIRPVFFDGKIASFITIRAHMLDMGGIIPAGFSAKKHNSYENGLVVPPTLLYCNDRPEKSVFKLIIDNTRYGDVLLPDIKSIYQSLRLGERLLTETMARYGHAALLGAIRYNCDVSADAMSEAIRTKIPDGVYESEEVLDADGVDESLEYVIRVKIVKSGDRIEVDLGGTSTEARTSINGGAFDAMSAVTSAFKLLIEQDVPISSGCNRNIDLVIPPGTVMSATPPNGAIFFYYECGALLVAAIYRALGNVLGVDAIGGAYGTSAAHIANGVYPDGKPWVSVAECGSERGPWGACRIADGENYSMERMLNSFDPPIETIEYNSPVVILRREYQADTGGAGYNRGGAAVMKDSYWPIAAEHISAPLHVKSTSGYGEYGGESSNTAAAIWMFERFAFNVSEEQDILPTSEDIYRRSIPIAGVFNVDSKCADPNGHYQYFADDQPWRTKAGAHFRYLSSGGGGWGNPLERESERVMRDVRDGYVTVEGALRDYGVVVVGDPMNDPERLKVDMKETTQTRARRI
jgi:N-methylhydantoinase B